MRNLLTFNLLTFNYITILYSGIINILTNKSSGSVGRLRMSLIMAII